MKLWGIQIKHPTPKDLTIATAIILTFVVVSQLMPESGDAGSRHHFPGLLAVAIGAIAASFGLSPAKGWRACVLLVVISVITYTAFQLLVG